MYLLFFKVFYEKFDHLNINFTTFSFFSTFTENNGRAKKNNHSKRCFYLIVNMNSYEVCVG